MFQWPVINWKDSVKGLKQSPGASWRTHDKMISMLWNTKKEYTFLWVFLQELFLSYLCGIAWTFFHWAQFQIKCFIWTHLFVYCCLFNGPLMDYCCFTASLWIYYLHCEALHWLTIVLQIFNIVISLCHHYSLSRMINKEREKSPKTPQWYLYKPY